MSEERHRDRIPADFTKEEKRPAHERRRARRIRADNTFFIGCKALGADANEADPNLAVKLIDVSSRGACFVSRSRVRAGLRVQVLIVRPGAGTRSSVDGTVRWSESLKSDGRTAHVTGVEFDKGITGLGLPEEPVHPAKKSQKIPKAVDPRRHHRRFKPEKTSVVAIPRDGFWRKLGFKPNSAHSLLDLSMGGAQIVSTKKLKPGLVLDVEIVLSDGKTTIATEGFVCWCRRDTLSLKPKWNVGVRFGKLDEDAKRSLTEVQQIHVR
ncbi:MAG TPA: PilZ domain-containing protein [Planctomycetota bacterium]